MTKGGAAAAETDSKERRRWQQDGLGDRDGVGSDVEMTATPTVVGLHRQRERMRKKGGTRDW